MPEEHSKTSIIIPTYNRVDALPTTLQALAKQTLKADCFEVIVVDDGSSDNTVEKIKELKPALPYHLSLLHQEHRRQAAARNRGAREANFPILLFLDSDIVATPKLVETHVALQREDGPALVAGARRFWPKACTTIFSLVKHEAAPGRDQFDGKSPSFQEVFSANFSISKKQFEQLGGFDETLWAFEDTDFAYRAQQVGIQLLFSRDALGYHNHPMTLKEASNQEHRYQHYAAAFLRKHPELKSKIRHLRDKGPIDWQDDPLRLIVRKVARYFLATPPALLAMESTTKFLETYWQNQHALIFLYNKILSSYMLHGFRVGLRHQQPFKEE